jgi:undecaprenyl diphosphate synthase
VPRSGGRRPGRAEGLDVAGTPQCDGALPEHVAVIMDGNGRWAEARGKRRLAGHRAGAEAVRQIVRAASDSGLRVLTLYAFSTENWSRPRGEVAGLFKLLKYFLKRETPDLAERGVRLRAIGRTRELARDVQEAIRRAENATSAGAGMVLCLAINYGAQDELVDAARALASEARDGMIRPEAIGRSDVERCLHTSGLPPVDLLIRTGGELRVSNFLLWQLSYAELYFTPVCWPAFGRTEFGEALAEFQRRQRRYGGL